jgi:outer membrane protein assembly factor BamB
MVADGKIYVTDKEGLTTVVKAGPVFEVLAENALNDYCLSSPAISGGQIFIPTATNLYAIGKK